MWPNDSEHYTPGSAPSLDDIAIGLSRMPRFAGQTKTFYTVLLHTFVVSELVEGPARTYALLHDAPEALVADVPTPWKTSAAKEREEDLIARICAEHGIVWPAPPDLWEEVMWADAIALAAEAHVLGHTEAETYWPREKWCAYTFEAEYKTKAYIASVGGGTRLIDVPDHAAKLYRERVAHARRFLPTDARTDA